MLAKVFADCSAIRSGPLPFDDVGAGNWAYAPIRKMWSCGIMSGTGGRTFAPDATLTKGQTIVAITSAFRFDTDAVGPQIPARLRDYYIDHLSIPAWAQMEVLAATESGAIINWPDRRLLGADHFAHRDDVSALLYQALVLRGEAAPIATEYWVEPN